ncbi:hypothetical protein ACFWP3_35400 [Streptomyces sp. NPDC058525]|uniref:hypothetical protein n=1 Tax=Streptomyces sp. NPDC058525 TaxID=3346538 RepID=UPI0036674EAF
MKPLDDTDVAVPDTEDPHQVGRSLGRQGMWQRGKDWIATANSTWLHLGDYRNAADGWEAMFLPNGLGTVEWRLGWAVTIPPGTFLMVMPPPDGPPDGLTVPLGVIPAEAVNRMGERGGMTIAVRPHRDVTVHRGQDIARIVLLHSDSLRTITHLQTAWPDTAESDPARPARPDPGDAEPGPPTGLPPVDHGAAARPKAGR